MACNGPRQKLRLVCTTVSGLSGLAWQMLDTCPSTGNGFNCDNRDASCQAIIPACVGQAPGYAYCEIGTNPAYTDVRKTCGPDLVSNDTNTTCSGVCAAGVCQAATCGDKKTETTEECDDGNTKPLDGCEPSCVKSGVQKVALGDGHTCMLGRGGYVRCWGTNTNGELGLGNTTPVQAGMLPYQIPDSTGAAGGYVNLGTTAIDVTAGLGFTCALLTGGSVRCWGANDQGQLGLGSTTAMPTTIGGVVNFGSAHAVAISAGPNNVCALLDNNTIHCWGANNLGQAGVGSATDPSLSPSTTVALGSGVTPTGISVGGDSACALLSTNKIHCWGDNFFGEFGLGSATPADSTAVLPSSYADAMLTSVATAASVTVGSDFNCARLSDGEVTCWGYNSNGQLGLGSTQTIGDNEIPGSAALVSTGSAVTSVVAGFTHTCALTTTGTLKCWGQNNLGQLGQGSNTAWGKTPSTLPINVPAVKFPSGTTPSAVFVGNSRTCALLNNGALKCWGWNDRGQLGLGTISSSVGTASTETPDQLASIQVFPP